MAWLPARCKAIRSNSDNGTVDAFPYARRELLAVTTGNSVLGLCSEDSDGNLFPGEA